MKRPPAIIVKPHYTKIDESGCMQCSEALGLDTSALETSMKLFGGGKSPEATSFNTRPMVSVRLTDAFPVLEQTHNKL